MASLKEKLMLFVVTEWKKSQKSYVWHYSIPLFLLGKNRPLTRICPQEEVPPWHQGADFAAHLVDMKWFWTDMGYMAFRGTCWWKISLTSTSRSPPGTVPPCVKPIWSSFFVCLFVCSNRSVHQRLVCSSQTWFSLKMFIQGRIAHGRRELVAKALYQFKNEVIH